MSAQRRSHAWKSYTNGVYKAAPQETTGESETKPDLQTMSQWDATMLVILDVLLQRALTSKQQLGSKIYSQHLPDQMRRPNILWTRRYPRQVLKWCCSRRVDRRGEETASVLTAWPSPVRSGGSAASWQGPCCRRSSASPGRMPEEFRGSKKNKNKNKKSRQRVASLVKCQT